MVQLPESQYDNIKMLKETKERKGSGWGGADAVESKFQSLSLSLALAPALSLSH